MHYYFITDQTPNVHTLSCSFTILLSFDTSCKFMHSPLLFALAAVFYLLAAACYCRLFFVHSFSMAQRFTDSLYYAGKIFFVIIHFLYYILFTLTKVILFRIGNDLTFSRVILFIYLEVLFNEPICFIVFQSLQQYILQQNMSN